MKNIFLAGALMISMHFFVSAQIAISTARSLPLGSTVTVSGIVTNGSELGTIRYIQDGTAGIALFSIVLAGVQRGDEITVTGTTVEYQNLLEIQPVSNWNLISSNNLLPSPVFLTPNQFGENYESQLISLNNVAFTNAGGIFQGNTTATFTANGETGVVYLRNGHPLVGTQIPTSQVNITGILSQYQNQYQLLLRDADDISITSSVSITIQPFPSNITTTSFDVNWETNVASSTIIEYGKTPALELGYLSGLAGVSHMISIINTLPSEIYYVRAISVAGTDTAFSAVKVFMSASNSSGDIKVYFNRPVEHNASLSPANNAVYLNNIMVDTIAAYITRAQQTIDVAIYNFSSTGTQSIINALNLAHLNGKQVRIIAEGGNTNSALPSLHPSIPVYLSPTGFNYGIMHHKFVIIDAEVINPLMPVVLTGSTNWTDNQINTDRNNLVIIQDRSLAKAYKMEFEEMWGGSGMQPNSSNSNFGQYKSDDTPHHFIIGGRPVELYFSPSDNTNSKLIEKVNTADNDLYYALLSFTRTDVAAAIAGRASAGVYIAGMVNDTGSGGSQAFNIIQSAPGTNIMLYNHSQLPGILHHKYMIADQGTAGSNPFVWTGSHNWSTSANTRNDENTLIIYDQDIANQYYQDFVKMFNENGGFLHTDEEFGAELIIFPNPTPGIFNIYLSHTTSKKLHLAAYNLTGQRVVSLLNEEFSGNNSFQADFSHLPPGTYILELSTGNSTIRNRILVLY